MHRLYCLSVVGSLRYSLAFYHVSPREFLVNWATMTAPIVNKKLHFEDCFKVHKTFIQNKKNDCDNIPYGTVCGIFWNFEGFWMYVLRVLLTLLCLTWTLLCLSADGDASSEHSVSSGGSTSVGSRNTLLAMNTQSQQTRRAINRIDTDMRIDSTFFNPDSLWRRNQEGWDIDREHNETPLACGILQQSAFVLNMSCFV